MSPRNRFLLQSKGFSLVGTLVAVMVGSALAAIVVYTLGLAIKSQRSIVEVDEASDFAVYVTGLLTSDSTCTALLRGKAFPTQGTAAVSLTGVGYGDQPAVNLEKGFSFAGLTLDSFTIENMTAAPAGFKISVESPSGSGTFVERKVFRHIARARIALTKGESPYRTRSFEFPVLVNDGGSIESCNNEINIGDACQALGFKWDTSTDPASCVPQNVCAFGGAYTVTRTGVCKSKHLITDDCVCPLGFKPLALGAINVAPETKCAKGCDTVILNHDTVVQCYRCPL